MSKYTDRLKDQVFDLCGKESYGVIAKKKGISKSTAKRWCDELEYEEDADESDDETEHIIYAKDDKYLGIKLLIGFGLFLGLLLFFIFRKPPS